MTKKFRLKIFFLTLGSVFLFIASLLTVINIISFAMVASNADEITYNLQNSNRRIEPEGKKDPNKPPFNPDMENSLRYFTYSFDHNNKPVLIDYKINSFSQEECLSWARSFPHNDKTGWSKTNYRYRVTNKGDLRFVTVIDQSRELKPAYNVLNVSVVGGVSGLAIVGVIAFFLAKRIVKPFVDNEFKQNRFIADAALALRTPISIISIDNASLINENGEKEENKSIRKQVNKMFALADDLNVLSSKKIKNPHFVQFNLGNVVKEVSSQFEDAIKTNKKVLSLDIDDNVTYNGDDQMFRKAFSEIFDNCLKFADSKIDVSLKKSDSRIEINFVNDCKGIPTGFLDRVFDKFYRLNFKDHSKYDGSGIGLSIVKEIIDSHKGRIIAKGENDSFVLKIEL